MMSALPLRSAISQAYARSDHSIGSTVKSAVCVGYCSAIAFGTSSPRMTDRTVSTMRKMAAETSSGRVLVEPCPARQERRGPRGEDGARIRAENQAGERDADLGGGDVAIERGRRIEDRQQARRERTAVLRHPSQPAPAGANSSELGRYIQRGERDEQQDDARSHQHADKSY